MRMKLEPWKLAHDRVFLPTATLERVIEVSS
jgi:hypothetical protein